MNHTTCFTKNLLFFSSFLLGGRDYQMEEKERERGKKKIITRGRGGKKKSDMDLLALLANGDQLQLKGEASVRRNLGSTALGAIGPLWMIKKNNNNK